MEIEDKKKWLWGIGIGVVVIGALLFFNHLGQYVTYQDSKYQYSIRYPYGWKKKMSPQPGALAAFVSPQKDAKDPFLENVTITLEPVTPEFATLQPFADRTILQMTKVFSNMKVDESGEIKFGNRKGYRILFSAEKPDPVKIMTVFTIKNGKYAYILTYMAMADQYKKYLPKVMGMVSSFQLD